MKLRLDFLVFALTATIWCVSLAGCGVDAYEKRLEATRSYYAYLDKLDQNLSAPWKRPPIDVLRVPKQFQEVPAPQPATGPDGKAEPPDVDPRQPDYAGLSIKGLIGAWRTDVDAIVNNERAPQTAYLYAATNHEIFLGSGAEEAVNFSKDLIESMEAALQTTAKTEPLAVFPKGHLFSAKQSFDVYLLNSAVPIHGSRYVFEVYVTKQGDNQVAMIFAGPEGMDPQSKVAERIQLMLESLRVSPAPPQPKQNQAPGGAPAAPGPNPGAF